MQARFLTMFSLVFAGEMIFSLPYHVVRYFRPTVLEVFGATNADLGDMFAPYGVMAMLAYFPGGVLADRYSPRRLMTVALVATAAGGLYMMTLPGFVGMSILYAFWGVTSILPFWSAMIRVTRAWGGDLAQGRGFGLLDGGRGLVGGLFASFGVLLLRAGVGADASLADASERTAALQTVILYYTVGTLAAAVVVWWCIPDPPGSTKARSQRTAVVIGRVLGVPVVWMLAAVVVCAYCGYRGLDYYSLYAFDVLGMDEVAAAGFAATATYVRPVAAVVAGFLGDRFGIAWITVCSFISIGACWVVLGSFAIDPRLLFIVFANLFITMFGVYALRGLYFALLEQTRVPRSLTGAAVGLISLVGFTPDIFYGPIVGRLLDATPGVGGYQDCFLLLSGIASIGLVVAAVLNRVYGSTKSLEQVG